MASQNVHKLAHYLSSAVDWTFTNDLFGDSGIKIGDADGLVEVNGVLLPLERKLPHKLGIEPGQRTMFRRLAQRGDTAIAFWATGGSLADVRQVDCRTCGSVLGIRPSARPLAVDRMVIFGPDGTRQIKPATQDDLRRAIADWYQQARISGPAR